MNKRLHKRKRLASVLILYNFFFGTAVAQVRVAAPLPAGYSSSLPKIYEKYKDELVKRGFSRLRWPSSVEIKTLDPALRLNVWARSRANVVELNANLPPSDLESIFRHELSHVVFETTCPRLTEQSPLTAETFALWSSGDYQRVAMNSKEFVFKQAAQIWLKSAFGKRAPLRKRGEEAISRLLLTDSDEGNWTKIFSSLMRDCERRGPAIAENALAEGFKTELTGAKKEPVDFVLLDSASGELLEEAGRTKARFPTASILKPHLVHVLPKLLESRTSKPTQEWNCPESVANRSERRWNWTEALARSCNGFFLDGLADEADLRDLTAYLAQFGIRGPASSASLIGLNPGFVGSLREIAFSYRFLEMAGAPIIEALKETARIGTVSKEPAAAWFVNNKIAIKTGTTRTSDGKPLQGWIVAVAKRSTSDSSLIAVIHGVGRAPAEILEDLKSRIAPWLARPNRTAAVQILGLVPPAKLRFECPEHRWVTRHPGKSWSFASSFEFSKVLVGTRAYCALGPIDAHFPSSTGKKLNRKYYGVIEVSTPAPPENLSSATEKQIRARGGSSLILHTSERHYVASVVASEFPNGSPEVLKALSFVVRNNLNFKRHEGKPVCDTTHCQVFAVEPNAPSKIKQRIKAAIDADEKANSPFIVGADWMPFYLGGLKPWEREIKLKSLMQAMSLNLEPGKIEISDDQVKFLGVASGEEILIKSASCEDVRNRLHLSSCPADSAKIGDNFRFRGKGEGHGLGIPLIEADLLARQGWTASRLLEKYFGKN